MNRENNKQHIVFAINTLEYGGAGKILRFVAEACLKEYKKVTIISLFDAKRGSNIQQNVNSVCLAFEPDNKLWRFKALPVLRRTIRELEPTLVCAFLSDVAVMMKLAMIGMSIPFVSAERGDPNDLDGSLWKPLVTWAYKTSDKCIFQLEGARDYFGKKVVAKSVIIPNPYLEGIIKPWYGTRKKTIVSAGRFEYQKGYDILFEAYYMVHKKHPDYQMIIYGDGSLKNEYVNKLNNLGLTNNVSFPGYITNVAEAIKEEGIFVLPSRFEGIPNVLIEAMCTGIPTISTNCPPGGPAFLTGNGKRGLLVEVGKPDVLANAINQLIEDESLQHYYSINGPKIIDLLDKTAIEKKWLDALT